MDKLQELTDKLYNEGLAKGKEEGARILEDAKKKAEGIIADATREAEAIMEKARREADDCRQKVTSDLKMAAAQSFQATKKDIENIILAKVAGDNVKNALSSADFVKEIIRTVAGKFSSDESQDLSLVLPASLQNEMEPFINGELASVIGKGIDASFSKKIAGGFTIGPKDGGYFISLTDDTVNDLITEYLRPVTKKILFG